MVKWLERWAADPKVPGSNPALPAFFFAYRLLALFYIFFSDFTQSTCNPFFNSIKWNQKPIETLLICHGSLENNLLSGNSLICMTQGVLQIWLVNSTTWPNIAIRTSYNGGLPCRRYLVRIQLRPICFTFFKLSFLLWIRWKWEESVCYVRGNLLASF